MRTYKPNNRIIIHKHNNNYIVWVKGQLFIVQPIISSTQIPTHIMPATFWYLYIIHLLNRFGMAVPTTINRLP